MKYSIVYSSKTGNTKMLGEAIYDHLNKNDVLYCGEDSALALDADLIYVGFWTDKGSADAKTLEFLKELKNKKIFLFGTAGFGVSDDYFKSILARVKEHIDSSNEIVGEFMCMGKMPLSVKERYIKMREANPNMPNIDLLINNFDKALSHPDSDDIKNLIERI